MAGELIFDDPYMHINNVFANVSLVDYSGNTNDYVTNNSIKFDKSITSLEKVTIISNNNTRNMTHDNEIHHYAKYNGSKD